MSARLCLRLLKVVVQHWSGPSSGRASRETSKAMRVGKAPPDLHVCKNFRYLATRGVLRGSPEFSMAPQTGTYGCISSKLPALSDGVRVCTVRCHLLGVTCPYTWLHYSSPLQSFGWRRKASRILSRLVGVSTGVHLVNILPIQRMNPWDIKLWYLEQERRTVLDTICR
jgi:hypothetical protein